MRVHLTCPPGEQFIRGFARIREEFRVPASFPPDVVAAAHAAAWLPWTHDRRDRRDIELVTIDPEGSRDLDQAFHATRRGDGYRVHYAIADVGAFVASGGLIDAAATSA